MTVNFHDLAWPVSKLGEAIEAIARKSGLSPRHVEAPPPPASIIQTGGKAVGRWVETTAGLLGLEAEPVETTYPEVESFVRGGGPAILPLPGNGEAGYLALLGSKGRSVFLLAPDLSIHSIRAKIVRDWMTRNLEAPIEPSVEGLLRKAGVARRRLARARAAILRERLSQARINCGWLLRLRPGASFREQLNFARLPRHLVRLVGLYSLQYILGLLAWWILGKAALGDQLDRGWLIAWALLLLTAVPFRILATWSQGLFAIGAGSLLKQRLLYGALRLEPEEVRREGAGQMMGRVIESSAVESLALSGGFLGLVAIIELLMAAIVLALGAAGVLHVLALTGWVALAVFISWWYLRTRRHWTDTRLAMTNDLIERMVGHRTRLAQEARETWHEGEDQMAERYLDKSGAMDRAAAVHAGVARGWLLIGVTGLIPAFVQGSAPPAQVAISIGGILLASRALMKLVQSISSLASAAIAWRQVAPLFQAATREEAEPPAAVAGDFDMGGPVRGQTVLEAHDVVFRYRERGDAVLRGCNLKIQAGDRILLRGSSGGGKSTLTSLMTGLRSPDSGLLLLGGLDHRTVGSAAWRARVVAAPQFHENHVLTGTFAFNLLMGREWPPGAKDAEEAEAVCRELGLGNLLARMPAGLLQMVGETGWQLSHGERSRLYIARALLQNTDLVILDESFAALDPENLHQCLKCVLDRVPTLLVVAHP
ncbi:MAG TPA: ABC transporter ATP-binding protein [Blastocatellia bacterium]|nr:ABC transporter ATP-binding protein [Blastocatellia bacterium]